MSYKKRGTTVASGLLETSYKPGQPVGLDMPPRSKSTGISLPPAPLIINIDRNPDELREIADRYAELAKFCAGDQKYSCYPEISVVLALYREIYERKAPLAAHYQAVKAHGEGKKTAARELGTKAQVLLERIGDDEKP